MAPPCRKYSWVAVRSGEAAEVPNASSPRRKPLPLEVPVTSTKSPGLTKSVTVSSWPTSKPETSSTLNSRSTRKDPLLRLGHVAPAEDG